MKNFYYFSKRTLKFVEIRNFKKKFFFLTILFSFIFSFILFGSYFIINNIINSDAEVASLQIENKELTNRLNEVLKQFDDFNSQLENLADQNSALRLKANLSSISTDYNEFGVGGKKFSSINLSTSKELSSLLSTIENNIENIDLRIKFEKNNFEEIEKAFSVNEKLYDAIPAIKPSEGYYGDRFGMRLHPILKIKRMHNGLDMVTDVGTPVYAPGGGKVDYIGRRGGYGLTLEIDHGFGYRTLYGHLKKVEVKKGQKINRGDLIALSGKSGSLATGAHLHYEIRHNGVALNPRNFIYDDVKLFEVVSSD
jgi:murein DD-endopeptidase MepM/ murein hydrolase activator NlpD